MCLRVLFFDIFTQVGGIPSVAGRVINGLAEAGVACVVIDPFGDTRELLNITRHPNLEVIPLPLDPRFRRLRWREERGRARLLLFALVESLSYVYRLSQLVRKMRPTILYCNLPKSGVILAVVSRLTFRPLVFHTHGVENSSHIGRLYRIILAVAKKVICVSEHTRQQMVNAKVNPTKISVVYNGLDSSWFKDEALGATRAEFGLDSSAFVFGFVGNLIKRKGVDVLVKGFSETFTRLPARERIFVHLALVGDDPDGSRGQFISMARENVAKRGVIDNVHFLGRRTDIKRFMNSIDVLVLPARMESFGVVLIEAMSQGVPVIATAVAAIPEVVQDGVTGLLVPPERPLALADAMTSLYASPDLRRQLGERGRQDVRKRFSQEVLTRQLLEVINTHSRNDV